MLTETSDLQDQLADLYRLQRYAPQQVGSWAQKARNLNPHNKNTAFTVLTPRLIGPGALWPGAAGFGPGSGRGPQP